MDNNDEMSFHQVLRDMMTAIDADSSGTVSLDEWVEGGMNNVPLLVLLGLKVLLKEHFHYTFTLKAQCRCVSFLQQVYCKVMKTALLPLCAFLLSYASTLYRGLYADSVLQGVVKSTLSRASSALLECFSVFHLLCTICAHITQTACM